MWRASLAGWKGRQTAADRSRELFEEERWQDGRLVTCRVTEQDRAAGLDRAAEIPLGRQITAGFVFLSSGSIVRIYIPVRPIYLSGDQNVLFSPLFIIIFCFNFSSSRREG